MKRTPLRNFKKHFPSHLYLNSTQPLGVVLVLVTFKRPSTKLPDVAIECTSVGG